MGHRTDLDVVEQKKKFALASNQILAVNLIAIPTELSPLLYHTHYNYFHPDFRLISIICK
jgi:hypothetical protein